MRITLQGCALGPFLFLSGFMWGERTRCVISESVQKPDMFRVIGKHRHHPELNGRRKLLLAVNGRPWDNLVHTRLVSIPSVTDRSIII